MNSDLLKYGLLILLLSFLQGTIFNNINLMGYINPLFYIIFVIVFPFSNNKTALLLMSFSLGLIIDSLTNDGGIHAFSIVFIAFIRFFVLQIVTNKGNFKADEIAIKDIDFSSLILWVSILTFIHHFLLFSLEQFSFTNFSGLLLKTLLTSIFSIILIIFALQFFYQKK